MLGSYVWGMVILDMLCSNILPLKHWMFAMFRGSVWIIDLTQDGMAYVPQSELGCYIYIKFAGRMSSKKIRV